MTQQLFHCERAVSKRAGVATVLALILLVSLVGFVSLGVDFGRVQLTKTELFTASDAAARYAAAALPDPVAASARAIQIAAANKANGAPVVLLPSDVVVGFWNSTLRQFQPGGLPYNAVCVNAVLSSSRGNSVPLIFGGLVGASSCNVNARSIAAVNVPLNNYGIVGINSFHSQGLMITDSYPSGNLGTVVSNGDIALDLLGIIGVTRINGDAHPGAGHSIVYPALPWLTQITGSTAQLTTPLNYPPATLGSAGSTNDNQQLPISMFNGVDILEVIDSSIPGGTYVVRNLTLLANIQMRLTGPVTFYVTGQVNIVGTILVPGSDPANLRIMVVGPNPVNLIANVSTYMDLYAPESSVQLIAGLGYYGRLIGLTTTITGTSFIHYDEALGPPGGTPRVSLVK